MSRYTKTNGNIEFVYGYDHALGYFYEVWDNNLDPDDGPLEDKCVMFNRLTRNDIIKKMEDHKANKSHIESVALDLPF
jgi:hypothetical protein